MRQFARRAETIRPARVQRCGIGSSCDCAPHDRMAGIQRDIGGATAGGGSALPEGVRGTMEQAFAVDFSAVRIHTGEAADRVASGLGAHALTYGQHILFRLGEFRPHTSGGNRLIAHELAHVVQQARELPGAPIDSGPADPLEQAAEAAADRATAPMPAVEHWPPALTRYDAGRRPSPGLLEIPRADEPGPVGQRWFMRAETGMASRAAPAGAVIQRACGPDAIGKRDCPIGAGFFPPFADPYRFTVDCDTMQPGEEDRLRHDFKPGDVVVVHGYASIEGDPGYNEDLSCARAEKVAGILTNEVGATVKEVRAYGAIEGPREARRSVLVIGVSPAEPPHEPAAPPPDHVCGPDIDAQLTAVLTDIQQYFRGLSRWHKHRSCQQLEALFTYSMAWDINELYLPNTGWLRSPDFASAAPPCSLPQAGPGQDDEDPGICGNTVRVNGKCNLAGTVNYAAFGIMMSECYDFYNSVPWYAALLRTQLPFFNERALRALIWGYKKLNHDDPGPPTEFAKATFERGPAGRPGTENRPKCTARCESKAPLPGFTFTWEPYHPR